MATDFDFASALQAALQRVADQEAPSDDAPLSLDELPALDDYSPFNSPLTSITSSCRTSRSSSPARNCGSQSPPRKIPRTSDDSTGKASPSAQSFGVSLPPHSSAKARKRRRARARKKAKLVEKKAQARAEGTQFRDAFTYKVRLNLSSKYQDMLVISCDINASSLPHASSSYIGVRRSAGEGPVSLEGLIGEGFRYIEWDGRCVLSFLPLNNSLISKQYAHPHNRSRRENNRHSGRTTRRCRFLGKIHGASSGSSG